jgi:integrase
MRATILEFRSSTLAGGPYPRCSAVNQNIGKLKTVAWHPDLAIARSILKSSSELSQFGDWVFASPASGGRKPFWPDMLLNHKVRPAADGLGITNRIGWHTFRHTYASLLQSGGAYVKVVRHSLRNANSRVTMEMYARALAQDKRTAQTEVVQKCCQE